MNNLGLFDLTDRTALVTGASRGIGRAIAVGYAAAGAQVCAVARSERDLDETRKLAASLPGRIVSSVGDLSTARGVLDIADAAATALGSIDILVNNAGYDNEASMEETSDEDWQTVLDLNVTAVMRMCRAAAPYLKDGGGKVVNVASMFGIVAAREEFAYTVSKHAVVGLTRSLSLEWARKDVQVNALCPGFVETDMLASAVADDATAKFLRRSTPMGRWAQPEEMVGPAVFLASAASNFMTGQLLVVDGGYTVQ
jgi:2-dehydro-3-deoxy-D-gluconate 5-dehydrogenase